MQLDQSIIAEFLMSDLRTLAKKYGKPEYKTVLNNKFISQAAVTLATTHSLIKCKCKNCPRIISENRVLNNKVVVISLQFIYIVHSWFFFFCLRLCLFEKRTMRPLF